MTATAAVLVPLAAAGSAAATVDAGAGTTWTIRISVGDDERQTDQYRSEVGAISSTGRYVVFTAAASNLAAGDVNETWDAFVRDWAAGTTTLVSANSAGTPANSSSYGESITPDGRLVMFSSLATDLRDDDDDGDTFDVYVRDMRAGAVELASVNSRGAPGNGSSHGNMMTSDGRYVAFASMATNLAWGDTNDAFDVFLRDRRTRQTRLVSVPDRGGRANGESTEVSISADGRYAVFVSAATNLVRGDTNGVTDVFVRDLWAGATRRVSVSSAGAQADGASYGATANADGRHVAFTSDATNLVPAQNGGGVFLRDSWTGRTTEVSVSSSGVSGGGSGSRVSADGRYVAFNSDAPDLVPADTNNEGDAFLRRVR